MMPDFSALSNAQLDDAYASYFDAGDMPSANILGDEIVRRHFRSIGDFFTFDFFARYFPKYNVRVSLGSVASTAGAVVGTVAQGVADAPGKVLDAGVNAVKGVSSALLPLAVVVVIGAAVYLSRRREGEK